MLARQALSELVLANITDTITLFDRNWRYIYVNDAATRAIGLSREQILEQTLWELWCRRRERFAQERLNS